jgi:hypothetical protein
MLSNSSSGEFEEIENEKLRIRSKSVQQSSYKGQKDKPWKRVSKEELMLENLIKG